ncbi:calyx/pep [Sucra jujuba nucleopolyhedrovirus]|uniref:Calyx/pep n=1 Tax=Sucra jujuba nucleopolyhedrovirus TaxID=1563660 RepID=A0A097P948_9ABAC|nr:calyx/pep [Sucra jujuba nucleopolyhedrovirus]AIU41343.1 calyx/pep [Sucra jujuba nucleopolyhedrovirus]
MSSIVLTKKVHETSITAFLDPSWVLWVEAEDVLQVLRLPTSVLQSIPPRHKRCWNDFRCNAPLNQTYRPDPSKTFINIHGLGNVCNRVNSNHSDYLCTLFVAELYREACHHFHNNNGDHHHHNNNDRFSPRPPSPKPDCDKEDCHHKDCKPNCHYHHSHHCKPDCHHWHHDTLEKIARQNDLIVSGLGQLCINNSNQHLEMTNILNSIKLQNVTIAGQLSQLSESLDTQLSSIASDIRSLLDQLDKRLEDLLAAITKAFAQLQDGVRNDLTNINSILNNLTSSVTNINATLNNLLQAVNGLDLGSISTLLNTILDTVQEILEVLTPEILEKRFKQKDHN